MQLRPLASVNKMYNQYLERIFSHNLIRKCKPGESANIN